MNNIMIIRMKREIEILEKDPPYGIAVWLKNEEKINELEASKKK